MRKGLAKSIVLGLMVTTLGYGGMAEGATITSGTHDIGGEYNINERFTNADNSSIILNATDNVTINNASTEVGYLFRASNKGKISVNMNNYDLIYSGGTDLITITGANHSVSGSGEVAINNVHNLDVTSNNSSNMNIINPWAYAADIPITIDASGKITMKMIGNGGPLINADAANGYSNTIKIKAGEDIDISGIGNVLAVWAPKASIDITSTKGSIKLTAEQKKCIYNLGGDIHLKGKSVTVIGTGSNAIYNNAGTVDITSTDGNIYLDGKTAAISAKGAGDTNLHSDTTIAAGNSSVIATTNAAVTFDKALTATAAPVAVEASGGAKVTAMNASSAKQVAGTMTADGAGTSIDMNFLTGDSYYTGATTVSNDGAINLAFANDAPWNVTADSTLTKLDNNGVVNMRYTGAGNYETVTTDTLSGAGTLKVNTDLQASKDNLDVTTNSDKLVITGTSSGTHTIDVEDTSLLSGKKSEGYVLLVEDKTSGGATFVGGDVAKGGLYKYTPLIVSVNPGDNPDILDTYSNVPTGNVKNWYLAGYEKSGELQPVVAPLVGAGENRYAAYRFEQDNLLLRLGELRDNENSQGIWARVKTAKETVNDTTDSRFTMYQVGYDKKYKDDESGRKYFGVAFNHTKGDQDYSSTSNGESSSNAMTLYNTWLGKKGHYLDLVGKVGKINTDWDYSNARFPDSGDSAAWFYSLSGEYGRKIMNKDGFYTEPQAQLTYGRINGAGYTSDSGINVDQDSINSLIGRVGFTIGKHFNGDEDGKRTNVYAKLFYNHEFLGDSDVRMNDTYGDSYSHSGDFGGSWWTAGVGVTAQLDKKTNAYFDVQKTFGGDIDQKWQFNVGLRWNWGGAKK